MREYIDREKLLENIDNRVNAYYDEHYVIKDMCMQLIENAPTEDVVPRSEVDLENAKQEVAEQIFAEIDKIEFCKRVFAELKKKYIGE